MSDPNDYTVGWICAIHPEYVAAQVFLDEKHDGPASVSVHDNNHYTLGRIGKHNVAIAVLPDGEYGIASATRVAGDMLHSFPNIRIGLMVGIGGGAPSSEHDIRLGDVVVSAPRNGKGGVLQYDFGKTIQNQSFQRTGFLNQPPPVLRAAVAGIKAKYEIDGHDIDERIIKALESRKRLKKSYGKPSVETDRLYLPTVVHPPDNARPCAEVCSGIQEHLVLRVTRDEDDDNPAIHYGQIASANQLMKDSVLRDELARENDVLCFEMEAAGLMNQFPCLVIRGICDYSDTHKNKDWQGYAAMTAAAYAKDVLSEISPNKVEAERKIIDIISSVENKIQDVHHNLKHLASQQDRDRIYNWLSPSDPSTNYNKALQQRQDGTGQWLLQMPSFEQWKSQKDSFMWLHGIPGCGKTILSSTIVQHLEDAHPDSLLYFYFDFNDSNKQTLDNMVSSLISQSYSRYKGARKPLEALFSSCSDGQARPSCESLCDTFTQMAEEMEEVWIVIDALDECKTRTGTETQGLLKWMRVLLSSSRQNIHLLVTSRPEQDISAEIECMSLNGESIIPIHSELIKADIDSYVHSKVRDGDGLKRWRSRPDVQQEIENKLIEKANGMFRWVSCQIDALEKCLEPRSLRVALESLPETLDETYKRIIRAIPNENKRTATRILQLLTYTNQPMELAEIVDAIAVDTKEEPYFCTNDRMPNPQEVLLYCSSLVVIVSSRRLQLAHFSVKEYLTSTRLDGPIAQDMQETKARASIAIICLAYLLHFNQYMTQQKVIKDYHFARFCTYEWMDHARLAEDESPELMPWIDRLFCQHQTAYRIFDDLYVSYHRDSKVQEWRTWESRRTPPLYHAASKGLRKTVMLLLSKGADVNARTSRENTALEVALHEGFTQVAELLLDKGAGINFGATHAFTPLDLASMQGHMDIVRLLLKKDTSIDLLEFRDHMKALCGASQCGCIQAVELLLDNIKQPARDCYFENRFKVCITEALSKASRGGHTRVVELLLKREPDLAVDNVELQSILKAAVRSGYREIIELLLKAGAYPGTHGVDREHDTLLNLLASRGYTDFIQFVHEKVPTNGCLLDLHGRTPLHLAAKGGHVDTFEYLINTGIDPATLDEKGDGILCYAILSNRLEMVEAILEKDFETTHNTAHWSPLHWACRTGNARIVELLIEKGYRSYEVTAQALEGRWSPLAVAQYHRGRDWQANISEPCRPLLGIGCAPDQYCGGFVFDRRCSGCGLDIVEQSFECCTCSPVIFYCFMCKSSLEHLHLGHRWKILMKEDTWGYRTYPSVSEESENEFE